MNAFKKVAWAPLALSLLMIGCGSGISRAYVDAAQASYTSVPENRLGPRDEFSLDIYPEGSLNRTYTVSPEGTINHPLLGPIHVDGLSCFEVEQEITRRLADGILTSPIVICNVQKVRSQVVIVMGAVKTPGALAYTRGMTLLDLVSRMGGFGTNASKDRVQLTRMIDGQKKELVIPVQKVMRGRAPDMMLKPGDVFYVPTIGLFQ